MRWVWLYTTPYLIRRARPPAAQRLRRVGARQRMVSAVAGFRGAVSLAAALAVPHTLRLRRALPRPRPHRRRHLRGHRADPAAGAAAARRWCAGPGCPSTPPSTEERHLAEVLDHRRRDRRDRRPPQPSSAPTSGSSSGCGTRSTSGASCSPPTAPSDDPVVLHDDQYTALRLALIARKRAAPCCSCATSSGSTTSCCARSRPAWTRKRSAYPAVRPANSERQTEPRRTPAA